MDRATAHQAAARAAQIAHRETVQHIGPAYFETTTGAESVAALQLHGLKVGGASADDVERADLQHSYAIRAQSFDAGDYVVMNERGQIYKLDATTITAREEFSPPAVRRRKQDRRAPDPDRGRQSADRSGLARTA